MWICVLQADGQSGSHARPARGGEWMQVLEPSRLAPGFSAGNPRLGSRQHSVEIWWVLGNGSTFNELLHIREDRSLMMLPECNNAESFTSCHVIVDNKLFVLHHHCCALLSITMWQKEKLKEFMLFFQILGDQFWIEQLIKLCHFP